MIKKRLIFIQSTYGDAHQMIRYVELCKHYQESKLLAFERAYYKSTKDLDFISLGNIEHGKILGRIGTYIKAIKFIFKAKADHLENDIFFYGFDLLPLLVLANSFLRCRLIFEIPDLREIFFSKSLFSFISVKMIKVTLKKVPIVVVTSELFVSKYFKNNEIDVNKYFEIENKVHLSQNVPGAGKETRSLITIGYFGVIRCERSLEVLLKFLDTSQRCQLVIYGYFMKIPEEIKNTILSHPKINYRGEYKSPDDLSTIYEEIDISWIAYPYAHGNEDGNYRYARTNRYYEAGFFKKPMIASHRSGDAKYVKELKFGMVLNLGNVQDSLGKLGQLNFEKIIKWETVLSRIPDHYFQTTENDYHPLLEALGE